MRLLDDGFCADINHMHSNVSTLERVENNQKDSTEKNEAATPKGLKHSHIISASEFRMFRAEWKSLEIQTRNLLTLT